MGSLRPLADPCNKVAWNPYCKANSAGPFDRAIASIIGTIVDRIIQVEPERGPISRIARSKLAPKSQAWQDVIDRSFAMMAGIDRKEHKAFRERLAALV